MRVHRPGLSATAAGILALCVLACGCTSTPAAAKGSQFAKKIFYPFPPDPPRVQFLRGINASWDIVPERSGLAAVALGPRDETSSNDVLLQPYGVGTWQGKIYVCDRRAGAAKVFDLKNRAYYVLGGANRIVSEPTNLYIDSDGYKFIVETMLGLIQVFDPDDNFVTTIRVTDGRPADLVAVGSELFVPDVANDRIMVLDRSTGKLLRTLGSKGKEPGQFLMPNAIARDSDGNLYVCDQMNFRIQKIDRDGKPLLTFGRAGDSYGEFARPRGIAVGPDGTIFVVESVYEVVQMFNQEGKVLMAFGNLHAAPGFLELPAGIAVDTSCLPYVKDYINPAFDPEYLVIVISQVGGTRIGIYAFGSLKPGAEVSARALPKPQTETAPVLNVDTGAAEPPDIDEPVPAANQQ
jgi:DNA-binding beta-propeller fold protein YncE